MSSKRTAGKRFVRYTIEVARELKHTTLEGLEMDDDDDNDKPVAWSVQRRYSEFVVLHN